jgi:signal peptide peptidase SppA
MNLFNPFLQRLAIDVPLMEVQTLQFLCNLELTADNIKLAEHPGFKELRDDTKPKMERRDGAAIIPIQGALAYNPSAFELLSGRVEDSRCVLCMINEAAQDPDIKGILLRMDTPGGMLLGGPEMADAVANARAAGKPVVAHAGGLTASLGYMIASQANEIVANRSAIVGSIGVIASVVDFSDLLAKYGIKFEYFTNRDAKYKGTGALGKPLTLDQRQNLQDSVESAAQMFMDMVTKARPQVQAETMQGQTFRGDQAMRNGLIDRVGDEDFAFAVLKEKMPKAASSGPYIG